MSAAEFWELYGDWGKHDDGTPNQVTVETLDGQGAYGETFAAPRDAEGLPMMGQHRLIKTSTGNEAVSGTVLYAPLPDFAGWFTLGTRVTLEDGRRPAVLLVETFDAQGLFSYVVVHLE